jgi:hypothetical protein
VRSLVSPFMLLIRLFVPMCEQATDIREVYLRLLRRRKDPRAVDGLAKKEEQTLVVRVTHASPHSSPIATLIVRPPCRSIDVFQDVCIGQNKRRG